MIGNEVNGKLYVKLGDYIKKLKATEKRKPQEKRLSVPTFKQLSEVAGISASNLSHIANGHVRSLNLDIAASIITEMRRRGFDTEITDILKFEMPEELKHQPIKTNDPWVPPPPPLTRRQRRKYPGDEFVKAYAESESTTEEEAAKVVPEEAGVG